MVATRRHAVRLLQHAPKKPNNALEDGQLWAALFRVCGRLRDQLSLEVSVQRLRTALVELGVGAGADTVPLPLSRERVLEEVRAALDSHLVTPRTVREVSGA